RGAHVAHAEASGLVLDYQAATRRLQATLAALHARGIDSDRLAARSLDVHGVRAGSDRGGAHVDLGRVSAGGVHARGIGDVTQLSAEGLSAERRSDGSLSAGAHAGHLRGLDTPRLAATSADFAELDVRRS